MVITSFEFEDKAFEWKLERISLKKITLLIGASGVGKTQILKAINTLKHIADGGARNGVRWNVHFYDIENNKYEWSGEFENKKKSFLQIYKEGEERNEQKEVPNIVYEKLYINGEVIIERSNDKIIFSGTETVKLSQQHSAIFLLKEEDKIKPVHTSIKKIKLIDNSFNNTNITDFVYRVISAYDLQYSSEKCNNIEEIQESDKDTIIKLYLLQNNVKEKFTIIKDRFTNIFKQVEDIKIAPDKIKHELKGAPIIQIKERGVKEWITEERISSGMFRTLMQLSELYLCPEETVFLIDEFENSLGINCIDEIVQDILESNRKLQFIMTSHHPYIINAIEYDNWKLVTRKAGTIKTHDMEKFNFKKSKHSAFMELIQLDEYNTGQEV